MAAEIFGIARPVLQKIGELTAKKGGKEARKIDGAYSDFTSAERTWLHQVLKVLLRRAAEVAYDSNARLNQITMQNLPPI